MSSKVKAKARQSISLGYKLSSEEQTPSDLVRYAHMAEESGFTFAPRRPSWSSLSFVF